MCQEEGGPDPGSGKEIQDFLDVRLFSLARNWRVPGLIIPILRNSYIALALGWILFLFFVYKAATTRPTEAKLWDPFEILGISEVRCHKIVT